MKPLLAALLIVMTGAGAASAFSYSDCGGQDCAWPKYPITYYIREPLGGNLDEETALEAIQASFRRWDY